MPEIQDATNQLYSHLYGSITIPNNIVKQEEEDASIFMGLFGFDNYKYEEVDYEHNY